ncbi:MAG: helix-turn-helix transcriptional regulator [Clostridia bacterium]|nr:helix-turn-helix transcriptional regulator [Clostridia bacterium]
MNEIININRISISDRIKEYRRSRALTQGEFGRLLGVSPQAVCKWERGVCYPDITFLPDLARILGCRIDDFFEE